MKKLLLLCTILPFVLFGNDKEIPSKIKEVTVYLSGAEIKRNATFLLKEGTTEIIFTGLSTKVDESSIQVSGLKGASIIAMSYDINYLVNPKKSPEIELLKTQTKQIKASIASFKSIIQGLEEEEKVIISNRLISSEKQADLEKIKQVSTYYRERITAIKKEVYVIKQKIALLQEENNTIQKQLKEINQSPKKGQGELKIVFDSPIATNLNLQFSYLVSNAGWIPNYTIKSNGINAPLKLAYKAHVYQKTGNDWNQVKINLSSGVPNTNVTKPTIGAKYVNFTNGYQKKYSANAIKKTKYHYNPSVKQVRGTLEDETGLPLPGANVVIKGTSQGTQTDFDGNYILKITQGQALEFSYIGYHTQDIPIFSSIMNVQLEEDISQLEEVVVVGYGTTTSSALSGSVTGVQIRGSSSIPKPQLPLYVIDGLVAENFIEGNLDPEEIQSIEILKSASSVSVYGSRGINGVVLITTKKSYTKEGVTKTKFEIKKSYTINSDADITAIGINTYTLDATYEYIAIPVLNENVFLTASFKNWEKYNLLPGEASVYFNGSFAGKTTIDPYQLKKEMTLSLGMDDHITVQRKRVNDFKSKSFAGNNRILNKGYQLEIKNNKTTPIALKIMDRIPLSQNKEIKIDVINTDDARYIDKKGVLE